MKLFILGAGLGTRLRALGLDVPKVMAPIGGKPLLQHHVELFRAQGFTEFIVNLHHLPEKITGYFGDGSRFGVRMTYSFEPELLGTAGAVKLLEDRLDDVFMVGSGDTLTDADLSSLVAMHFNRSAMATMGLTEVERPEQFGIVGISSDGRVQRFKEKPRPEEVFSNVINSGTYVLSKKILELVPEGRKYDFSKDLFPDVLARGLPLYATRLEGYWKDIGRPHDLLEANLKMAEMQGEPTFIPGLTTEGPIVARDASGEGGMVVGPSFLDDGSWIGKGATVASSCLGKGVLIEGAAVVRSSLLLDGCIVSEAASVTDCVIGKNCVIGKGVSLSNSVLGDDVVIEGPQKLEGVTRQTEDPQRSC